MNDLVVATISGVIFSGAVTFLITWGMMRGKITETERRMNQCENEQREIYTRLSGLHEIFVSQQHFNEIMGTIRETQKELRDDMKKILSFIAKRGEL